jgi:2-haloacid dehalogenase
MCFGRRRVLQASAVAAIATVLAPAALATNRTTAVAFDGFVIFDPRPVYGQLETLFPGKGSEIANLWRTRQFEYTWLRTITGRYADFWQVTGEALAFATKAVGVELTPEQRDRLMQGFLEMQAHPDVLPGLKALRAAGVRLGFLSNLTERMLRSAVTGAGLDGLFEQFLSTDRVRAYKPDPRAYQMGIDGFGLRREQIVFAAFGGWDANGAKSFGYRTYWANRLKQPVEQLDARPDAIGAGVSELVQFVVHG